MKKIISKFFIVAMLYSFVFPQLVERLDYNAMKSILLPGWGESSINENKRAKLFFIGEACLWLSFFGSSSMNQSYKDNYLAFGSHHADIDLYDISDNDLSLLIVHMSQYDNMNQYNGDSDRMRNDDRYDNPKFEWNWDNRENRLSFNNLRVKSQTAGKIKTFVISGLILNRVISFIDMLYLNGSLKSNYKTQIIPTSEQSVEFTFSILF